MVAVHDYFRQSQGIQWVITSGLLLDRSERKRSRLVLEAELGRLQEQQSQQRQQHCPSIKRKMLEAVHEAEPTRLNSVVVGSVVLGRRGGRYSHLRSIPSPGLLEISCDTDPGPAYAIFLNLWPLSSYDLVVLIVLQVYWDRTVFQAQMVLGLFSPDSAQADFLPFEFSRVFLLYKKSVCRPKNLEKFSIIFFKKFYS